MTVVSGMPRSGTSLMMRMLDDGGVSAVTDGRRTADEHNPHGYFEDERAKRLAQESAWLGEARGRAVKIVYRLLPHLPPQLDYRIVFMERDLDEVYDSQQDMLQSRGDAAAAQDRDRMIRALSRDLEGAKHWLSTQCHIVVPYRDLVRQPAFWAANVSRFLGGDLDEDLMAAAVEPSLYRHRRS